MRVKDVVICALGKLNLRETAEKIASGGQTDSFENEAVKTLVCCYNAVEDELARRYLPLTARDKLSSPDGVYVYAGFSRAPVKIKRVLSDGKEIAFTQEADRFTADSASVTVEYFYAPEKKKLDDFCECSAQAGVNLMADGMAPEYCFINGEADMADAFEAKYRSAIDAAQSKIRDRIHLPPRRWI